jgi:hypothetical protein
MDANWMNSTGSRRNQGRAESRGTGGLAAKERKNRKEKHPRIPWWEDFIATCERFGLLQCRGETDEVRNCGFLCALLWPSFRELLNYGKEGGPAEGQLTGQEGCILKEIRKFIESL